MRLRSFVVVCVFASPLMAEPRIDGTRITWHPLTITFKGPSATETDSSPNPFLDYRLQVTFAGPNGRVYDVPGFFDGDGNDAAAGEAWRVHFSPDQPGVWRYRANLRQGLGVAVSMDENPGDDVALPDAEGQIEIAPIDPSSPGFLNMGRLEYVGAYYLKFKNGPYWIRGGTDEPEDFLAYAGFANTKPSHKYADHISDWREGDPDWGDGKGRGIIGALNYLSGMHVNSLYFLTMNVGGDGKNVWPWVGPIDPKGNSDNDNLHYDTRKLRQWETVFNHAQRQGIFLHVVFNEAEKANKRELDDGELGNERKLYYREMIARFGHHLALQWNICEEYNLDFDFTPTRVRAFADFIRAVDPYDHPIAVHPVGDPVEALRFTIGDDRFSMTSIQLNQRPIHEVAEAFRREMEKACRPMPISLDEFTLDRGQRASHIPVDDAEGHRREKIWPTYLSGGNIEFILGDLLKTDSFKTQEREKLWTYLWNARNFMNEIPFWEMEPSDELCAGGAAIPLGIGKGKTISLGPQCLAKRGSVYAVYLPKGTPSGTVDLSDLRGPASQRWYDPRAGEFAGESIDVVPGSKHALGAPPADPESDWVALIAVKDQPPQAVRFPGQHWEHRAPGDLSIDAGKLDAFAEQTGGDGCIVKDGFVVKQWGKFDGHKDWASAAKPVLSTLLTLAIEEGKIASPDSLIEGLDWKLTGKDQRITYRQLANMVSGYACIEGPGEAWGYNDLAIQLYAKSLEKVFGQSLDDALRQRLAPLQFEDGEFFGSRHGLGVVASPRDYARLGWLWLHRWHWEDKPLLSSPLVDQFTRPGVPAYLPRTKGSAPEYLGIGSYGGGTNQTAFGPGVYGFNLWFNRTQPSRPRLFQSAPTDTFQANGLWSRDTLTVIPRLNLVVAVRNAKTDESFRVDPFDAFDKRFKLVMDAVGYKASSESEPSHALVPIEVRGFEDGSSHWRRFRDDSRVIRMLPDQPRHAPSQVKEIAENILLFQRANGGWPKDYDMLAVLTDEQKQAIRESHDRADTSFDNHNTHTQVEYLAHYVAQTNDVRAREACERGVDFILAAQMPNGGFPQRFPDPKGYSAHITFNDGVMIGIMNLLQDLSTGKSHWKWMDDRRRLRARSAVYSGIDCILKCQIRVEGRLTGWCQQHDASTYQPASARTFELASCCPQDTSEIIRFLMRQPEPSQQVVEAVEGGIDWLDQVALVDMTVECVATDPVSFSNYRSDYDVVVRAKPGAPRIWARHYEIGTDRPVFAGRDAVKRYSLSEIERERRSGTVWYGYWPQELLTRDYPRWKKDLVARG